MKSGFYPEIEERFRFRGAWWKPVLRVKEGNVSSRELYTIKGPMCLDCVALLKYKDDKDTTGYCPLCKREHKLELHPIELRGLAYIAYQAKIDKQLKPISLDSPIQPISDRAEDEKHWVEVRMGYSNDGRKIAIVYIGDKERGLKVQSFVDIDSEQLRGDRADAKPYEVVAKIKAEFLHSNHIIESKKE